MTEKKVNSVAKKTGETVIVICFLVRITNFSDKEDIEYEIMGNIEYSMLEYKMTFNDGFYTSNEPTIMIGDIRDDKFNKTVKEFFIEDCDFETMIFNHIKPINTRVVVNSLRDTDGAGEMIKHLINIAGGEKEAIRLIKKIGNIEYDDFSDSPQDGPVLTPIDTGNWRFPLRETTLIGKMRCKYEEFLKSLGKDVCDPTDTELKCSLDQAKFNKALESGKNVDEALDEQICPVCKLFGCEGWSRKFKLDINKGRVGFIELKEIGVQEKNFLETVLNC